MAFGVPMIQASYSLVWDIGLRSEVAHDSRPDLGDQTKGQLTNAGT